MPGEGPRAVARAMVEHRAGETLMWMRALVVLWCPEAVCLCCCTLTKGEGASRKRVKQTIRALTSVAQHTYFNIHAHSGRVLRPVFLTPRSESYAFLLCTRCHLNL